VSARLGKINVKLGSKMCGLGKINFIIGGQIEHYAWKYFMI